MPTTCKASAAFPVPSRTQVLALRGSWLVHYPQQPQLIKGAPLSHTLPGGGTCSTWLKDGSGAEDAAIHDQHVGTEQLLSWCLLLPKGRKHSRRRVTPLVGPCLTPQSEVLMNPKPPRGWARDCWQREALRPATDMQTCRQREARKPATDLG